MNEKYMPQHPYSATYLAAIIESELVKGKTMVKKYDYDSIGIMQPIEKYTIKLIITKISKGESS